MPPALAIKLSWKLSWNILINLPSRWPGSPRRVPEDVRFVVQVQNKVAPNRWLSQNIIYPRYRVSFSIYSLVPPTSHIQCPYPHRDIRLLLSNMARLTLWALLSFTFVTWVSTIAIKGPQGAVDVLTGERPFRQEFSVFKDSGPAFDLYIQSLRHFMQQNQSRLLSYYRVAGNHFTFTVVLLQC